MGIDTDFGFDHFVQDGTVQVRARALVGSGAAAAVASVDLLGPLRGFVGNTTKRTWSGTGFNMIWRPNFGGKSGFRSRCGGLHQLEDFRWRVL